MCFGFRARENRKRLTRTALLVLVVLLSLTTLVSAEYIGPADRTVKVKEERRVAYGVWARAPRYPCECMAGGICRDCTICEWEGSPGSACGDATYSYQLGTRLVETTVTHHLANATSAGSLNCVQSGNAGWCTGGLVADLSASEPVGGRMITSIETYSGVLCDPGDASNVACSIPVESEGAYNFDFWANSTWGDQSALRSLAVQLDTSPPQGLVVLPAVDGENGWYRHAFTAAPAGSDTVSGLESAVIQIDGSEPAPQVVIDSDGQHLLEVTVTDRAGWSAATSTVVKLDATFPVMVFDIPAPNGNNDWYVNPVTFKVSGNDATSGVDAAVISVDGGLEQPGEIDLPASDGQHTLSFSVADVAGNLVGHDLTIQVDRSAPQLNVLLAPADGGVVSGNLRLAGQVSDSTSGLAGMRFRVDQTDWQTLNMDVNGGWELLIDTLRLSGGAHQLLVEAEDLAGNRSQWVVNVMVANTPPRVELTERWAVWEAGQLHVLAGDLPVRSVHLRFSPSAYHPMAGSGANEYEIELDLSAGQAWSQALLWDRKLYTHDGQEWLAPPGDYDVDVVVTDSLAREVIAHGQIHIPAPLALPTWTPLPSPTLTATDPPVTPQPTLAKEEVETDMVAPAQVQGPPSTPARPSPAVRSLWPLATLGGMCLCFGWVTLRDERPRAIRHLAETGKRTIHISQEE